MPIFWKSEKYTKLQDILFKFGLFAEKNLRNSLNLMKIHLPFKSGGLIWKIVFSSPVCIFIAMRTGFNTNIFGKFMVEWKLWRKYKCKKILLRHC